jgi:hypothetical protein
MSFVLPVYFNIDGTTNKLQAYSELDNNPITSSVKYISRRLFVLRQRVPIILKAEQLVGIANDTLPDQ